MKITRKHYIFVGIIFFVLFIFYCSYPSKYPLLLKIDGRSMEPTFRNGSTVNYSDKLSPKVGDVIYFSCSKKECHDVDTEDGLIKRISSIHDDCFYLLGDNPDRSLDSRDFGELCGDQIAIHGVVIE